LIRDKIGRREFLVSREAVDDPEGYLNRMIREIYSSQSRVSDRQSDQGLEDKE